MTLREATLADIDALLDLERACYAPAQAYSRDEYRYSLARAKAVNLVRFEGDLAIGFVGAFHHKTQRVGHVYTVNVHPKERGRGLGRELMVACEDALRKLGMTRVVLEVNVENADAIRLYERCGYEQIQRLANYYTTYRVNDAWLYEKALLSK